MAQAASIEFVRKLFKVILIVTLFSSLGACEKLKDSQIASDRSQQNSKSIKTTKVKSVGANTPLWKRVRNNFELAPNQPNQKTHPDATQKVQKHVKKYRENEKTLNKLSKQATPYLFYVVEQLEARNMPGELALLPMIESAYQPHTTSPQGAAGLWQFIPSTGKYYGLKQNSWYDGRRDVMASTKAALDYLEFLHKEFNNDWMLALAAYNAGEGTVHKAIKRNIREGKPIKFWDLKLPKETQEYVPRFLALAHIIGNPEKHDIALPHIDNKPYFVPVNPGRSLSFHQVAKFADMPLNELKSLNSAYHRANKNPTAKGGLQEILLPVANAKKFQNNLEKEL